MLGYFSDNSRILLANEILVEVGGNNILSAVQAMFEVKNSVKE